MMSPPDAVFIHSRSAGRNARGKSPIPSTRRIARIRNPEFRGIRTPNVFPGEQKFAPFPTFARSVEYVDPVSGLFNEKACFLQPFGIRLCRNALDRPFPQPPEYGITRFQTAPALYCSRKNLVPIENSCSPAPERSTERRPAGVTTADKDTIPLFPEIRAPARFGSIVIHE